MAGQIHRQKKTSGFVILDVYCLQDPTLKWDAKGLHSYLMHLPDDWQVNMADLQNRGADGRNATASPMNALIAAGYVVRRRIAGADGRFEGYDYDVFERPQTHAESTLTVNGKSAYGKIENGKPALNKNEVQLGLKESKNEERGENFIFPYSSEYENSHSEPKKETPPPVAPPPPAAALEVTVFAPPEISTGIHGAPSVQVEVHPAAIREIIPARRAKAEPTPRTVQIPESHKAVEADLQKLLSKKHYLKKSDERLAREMDWLFSKPVAFAIRHIQNSLESGKPGGAWLALDFTGCEELFARWQRDERLREAARQQGPTEQPQMARAAQTYSTIYGERRL